MLSNKFASLLFLCLEKGERGMREKRDKRGIVKLLKFVNGAWQVVDYGIPEKTAIYTALGYVVER